MHCGGSNKGGRYYDRSRGESPTTVGRAADMHAKPRPNLGFREEIGIWLILASATITLNIFFFCKSQASTASRSCWLIATCPLCAVSCAVCISAFAFASANWALFTSGLLAPADAQTHSAATNKRRRHIAEVGGRSRQRQVPAG
jgi:hypothetical protein